jgi:hypothetical protein
MMTDKEKREVQFQTRMECARIAALESNYWGFVEDDRPHMADICIGAMGAAANIAGALFLGRTEKQVVDEIERRDLQIDAEGLEERLRQVQSEAAQS